MALGRTNFPGLKQDGTDNPQQQANVANNMLLGKLNCTAEWTLDAGATSTTFEDPRIYETSVFVFDPRSASARAALFGMYVSAIAKGEVTITHSNTADADKVFAVAILA